MLMNVHARTTFILARARRYIDDLPNLLGLQSNGHKSVDPVKSALDLNFVGDLLAEVRVFVCASVETLDTLVFGFTLHLGRHHGSITRTKDRHGTYRHSGYAIEGSYLPDDARIICEPVIFVRVEIEILALGLRTRT